MTQETPHPSLHPSGLSAPAGAVARAPLCAQPGPPAWDAQQESKRELRAVCYSVRSSAMLTSPGFTDSSVPDIEARGLLQDLYRDRRPAQLHVPPGGGGASTSIGMSEDVEGPLASPSFPGFLPQRESHRSLAPRGCVLPRRDV